MTTEKNETPAAEEPENPWAFLESPPKEEPERKDVLRVPITLVLKPETEEKPE